MALDISQIPAPLPVTVTIDSSDSPYNIPSDVEVIYTNITTGVTIVLPASPTDGRIITVKDLGGAGLSNVITINASPNSIEGSSSVSMNIPFESIRLRFNNAISTWLIL
jgi:uncharacterized protein YgbK (DUF1537 family)